MVLQVQQDLQAPVLLVLQAVQEQMVAQVPQAQQVLMEQQVLLE
jgi:hypothetical protein